MKTTIKDLKSCSLVLAHRSWGMECVFKGTHKACEEKQQELEGKEKAPAPVVKKEVIEVVDMSDPLKPCPLNDEEFDLLLRTIEGSENSN